MVFTTLFTTLAIGYLAIALILWWSQDQLIFIPQPLSELRQEQIGRLSNIEEVSIQTEDQKALKGWLIRAGNSKPLVICFGGNGDEMSYYLDDFIGYSNYNFLLMNYRGYGLSEGTPSEKHFFSDALCIYDAMINEYGFDPNKILGFGRSLGSGVAVHLASKRKLQGLILVSPYSSVKDIASDRYPLLPISLLLNHPFEVEALAHKMDLPLYVTLAQGDRVIPNKISYKLIQSWKGPKEVKEIKGVDHNNLVGSLEYRKFIEQAFRRFSNIKNQN